MPVVIILFFSALSSSFLAATCMLSAWLALGRTVLLIRLPIFLLGTLFLGWLATLLAANQVPHLFCTLASLVMWLGCYLASSSIGRGLLFSLGLLMFCAPLLSLQVVVLDTSWIARVTLVASFIALALSSLRWLDYRLVRLATGIDRLTLDIATGRSLDEWLWELDSQGGCNKNYAEIRRFLREQGIVDYWQKAITEAYQKNTGHRPVVKSESGEEFFVVVDRPTLRQLTQCIRTQRFEILDLLIASSTVAGVVAFLKWFPSFRPQYLDFVFGIPLVFVLTAMTLTAMKASLTLDVRHPWRPLLWGSLLIVLVLFAIQSIGLALFYKQIVTAISATVLGALFLMTLALNSLRQRGYRSARVSAQTLVPNSATPESLR